MSNGIYKILNQINGKYYIGSSYNIERRWITHKSHLKNHTHINIALQRAWDKYGPDAFKLEILLNCDGYTRDERFEAEQFYLDNIPNGNYNLSKYAGGGDNTSYHPEKDKIIEKITKSVKQRYESMTDEERDKLSIAMSGENNPMYGKTHSEEARNKISQKVIAYNKTHDNYRLGKTFEETFGEEEVIRIKRILSDAASQRVGEKNPFYGKTHDDETKKIISDKRKGKYHGSQNTPVVIDCIEYKSLSEASRALGIPIPTILWRVKSKNKKFISYYYKDKK